VVAEGFPDLAGDVAFDSADGVTSVCGGVGLLASVEVVGGLSVGADLGEDDGVDGPVGLAVPSPVEPMTLLSS
jgi:hypothetical protein